MRALASASKLLELFPALARDRKLVLQLEYSHSLAWLIVTQGKKQMAVTFRENKFRSSPIETYRGRGYIHPLAYDDTKLAALKSIRLYLSKGPEALLERRLQDSIGSGDWIPLDKFKRRMARRIKGWKRKKPVLEIPPSLLPVVQSRKEVALPNSSESKA